MIAPEVANNIQDGLNVSTVIFKFSGYFNSNGINVFLGSCFFNWLSLATWVGPGRDKW